MSDENQKKVNKHWPKQQAKLMEYISSFLDDEKLSKVLVNELGISRTAAYKRIRGETALSLYDLERLKKVINFSLDQFFQSKYTPTSFQYDALGSNPDTPLDFLMNVAGHMGRITNNRNVKYLYLANEVPLYHILQFPLLARFKMYVWNSLNWHIGKYSIDVFTKSTYTKIAKWDNTVDKLLKMYFDYSGKEIWNTLFFDTTIEQIKYMFMSAKIDIQLAKDLIDQLDMLKDLLNSFAEQGVKYIKDDPEQSSAETRFYFTSVNAGSEIIHIETDKVNTVLTGFAAPNLMGNIDTRMTDFSKKYINNILQHSVNITKSNPVQRNKFFKGLTNKLISAKRELEKIKDMY